MCSDLPAQDDIAGVSAQDKEKSRKAQLPTLLYALASKGTNSRLGFGRSNSTARSISCHVACGASGSPRAVGFIRLPSLIPADGNYLRNIPSLFATLPPITGSFSPTILTQICRTWREIAEATPDLWSRITLSAQELSLDKQIKVSDLWIRRSGSGPLAIELQNNKDENLMGLKSIIAHRLRWERLTLRVLTLTANVPPTNGPMPLLRYLDIHTRVEILPTGLNLVHCVLHFIYHDEETNVVLDINLSRLQTLILQDPYHECPIGFLASFVLPALHALQIPASFFGSTPLDDLRAFISKANCKVQKLHIIGELETFDEAAFHREFPTIGDISVR
ncbi:hypothetical protein B0H16DRAFT_1689016 [Mycena metata]|uniref:F-box domain-containing protein n=1 Tax=Mycena metata TaxID=1033252 RepID=A0AAD7JAJ1_9AGAR|nr:hypothetical protein B0H16DRAFT_1689016 [Mycena metata]